MKVSDIIQDKIARLQAGHVFTYDEFDVPVEKTAALIKALNRMVEAGQIRRLSKGRFYKPRKTEFGELKPEIYQVVKDLLEDKGKPTGYLTGYLAYNKLGLTTQVPATVQIGTNQDKKAMKRGMYKITFIKQPNRITKENIPLLRILDAVRYIKDIPGTTMDKATARLLAIFGAMDMADREKLQKLAMKYKPATRALTGALIETAANEQEAKPLYNSLNPATSYSFGISDKVLPNKQKWHIT